MGHNSVASQHYTVSPICVGSGALRTGLPSAGLHDCMSIWQLSPGDWTYA